MNIIDIYLSEHGLNRYQLFKISGIPQASWQNLTTYPIENIAGKYFIAIGNAVGKTPGEVLNDLLNLSMEDDDLNGLRQVLDDHGHFNIQLESEIRRLLNELDNLGVTVGPFTFNRLDQEEDPDLDKVMENIITMLGDAVFNVKNGEPPFKDK